MVASGLYQQSMTLNMVMTLSEPIFSSFMYITIVYQGSKQPGQKSAERQILI